MTKRISFVAHGTVQGVFFRAFTEQQATSYGITGWVRNRDDGKVEGEAQGEDSALDKLKKDLNDGPKQAKVVKLDTKEIPVKEGESSFTS